MKQPSYPRTQWRSRLLSFLVTAFFIGAACHAAAAAASTITVSGKPPSTVNAGSAYSFTPTASDSAGHTVTFSILNKPSWATFSATSGKLSGTPSAANVGKYAPIAIAASDSTSTSPELWFSITVAAAGSGGSAPTSPSGPVTLSGSPPSTVNAGSAYSFTPTATDSAGRTVTFAITGKPSWATFSAATGKLTGTPSTANLGKYAPIAIQASDGKTTSAMLWFSITVQSSGGGSSGSTVTIAGTPSTSVTEGKSYSFQPTAKDSAGRTVSFSVANKPSWAAFSISTGLLSGTPSATGSYSSITVSASDGQSSSSLAPFTISVVAPPASTGSATLGWTDPTKNTNGTSLTNLAGVHIYYGQSQSSLSNEVTVASTSQTSYTIGGLTAGTWYFAAAAYTTSGLQSGMSSVGSKTIQ